MKKVSVYLRVSTPDKGQDPYNQLPEIQEICKRRDWEITKEYIDHDTGSKDSRKEFQRLMADSRRGRVKHLVFWSLDRFSREGILETLNHLRNLANWGTDFISVKEPMLETVGPARELIIAILAYFAAFERERHRERVKAGIARAKAQGRVFGRKRIEVDGDALKKMVTENWSVRETARALGVGVGTAQRRIEELRKEKP